MTHRRLESELTRGPFKTVKRRAFSRTNKHLLTRSMWKLTTLPQSWKKNAGNQNENDVKAPESPPTQRVTNFY